LRRAWYRVVADVIIVKDAQWSARNTNKASGRRMGIRK
jgi:hypothetical protein